MKQLLIILLSLLAFSFVSPAYASISFVNHADNGGETGGSGNSWDTGSFSLTAGNLLVCIVGAVNGSQTYSAHDAAGNTWVGTSTINNASGAKSEIFYSFTTNGTSTETVTVDSSLSVIAGVLTCGQWSKTLQNWTLDAQPSPKDDSGGGSTPMVTNSFSTTQSDEVLVGLFRAAANDTYTTSTAKIAGNTASGVFTNTGTNGSTIDSVISYLLATSTYSNATASVSISPADNWNAHLLSFKETSPPSSSGPSPYCMVIGDNW